MDQDSLKSSDEITQEARVIGLLRPLRDVTVTAGETAMFDCELSHEGISMEWSLKNTKLVPKPPVEFTKPLENQTVEEEATAILECEVSREKAEVKWFRDGQEVRKTKKYDIVAEGRKRKLIIQGCTLDDSKTYTCDAKDFKTSAFLNVERK
ncbi:hypothetical protein GN956_G3810 [Arapaima gigas]